MTIPAHVLAKLATLGLSRDHAEAVAAMLTDVEAATKQESASAIEARRSNDRERKARERRRLSQDVTGSHVTSADISDIPPNKEKPPAPPKETTPLFENQKTRRVREASTIIPAISTIIEPEAAGTTAPAIAVPTVEAEFSEFWRAYPHRVGRPEAFKAFIRARTGERVRGKPQRKPVPLAAILEGVANYTRDKPPDHNWLNPSTFLNQERYADEPAAVMGRRRDTTTAELGDMLAQARLDIEREERAEHDPRRQIAHGYG